MPSPGPPPAVPSAAPEEAPRRLHPLIAPSPWISQPAQPPSLAFLCVNHEGREMLLVPALQSQ